MVDSFNPIIGAFDQSDLAPVPTVHLATTVRSAQEARTWLKLHSTSLVFQKETSLGDLIKAVRTATKGKGSDDSAIPIYLDPLGLQMAEKSLDSPIAWDVEGLPLSTSLPLILKQVGLRFNVMPRGLLLISAEINQDVPSDPSALILDNLSMLRDEVATLRARCSHFVAPGRITRKLRLSESRCLRLQRLQRTKAGKSTAKSRS